MPPCGRPSRPPRASRSHTAGHRRDPPGDGPDGHLALRRAGGCALRPETPAPSIWPAIRVCLARSAAVPASALSSGCWRARLSSAKRSGSSRTYSPATLYSSSVGTDFRETSPDLTGTCFGTNDLILARSVYAGVFADIDPEWPNDPTGPLASHWCAIDSYSAAYLIHLARVLWQLGNKNVIAKPFPILRDKVEMLLRPPSSASYEETLIELEVASSLSERISPISFDPLVPASLSNAPSKPKSLDYGLRLPDSDVTVEVTVWHWQVLRNWDAMTAS